MKELEAVTRSSSIDTLLKRNKELEAKVEDLEAQLTTQSEPVPQPMPDTLLMPQKVPLGWMPQPQVPHEWTGTVPSHMRPMEPQVTPVTDGSFSNTPNQVYAPVPPPAPPAGYNTPESQAEVPKSFTQTATPIMTPAWEDPMLFGNTSQAVTQPTPAWEPFHPAFNQPSRFADLQPSGMTDLLSHPPYTQQSSWQNQPSMFAGQISTKLKPPNSFLDQLMLSVIQSQRQLALEDPHGEEVSGSAFPSVHLLFNQPDPAKPPTTLSEVMGRYSAILSNRGFDLIPEKLASFMCMYRFVQWQISPTYQTYQKLHAWQQPRHAQLIIPHPAWMDLPPWGEFRERVIKNQDRYDNAEFQNDYASNLSINFPHDPMKALVFENGQLMVSPLMEQHLADINHFSMKKPFADKYPDFRDVCRFDEV